MGSEVRSFSETGLIYNQNDIPREVLRYGLRPSADTGCGWVAMHNALCLLGKKTDTEELIRYLQWQLPLIHGNAGTSFWSPAVCFRKWGYETELVADRRRFDAAAKEADVCILFYRWRRKAKFGAHFVALHHTQNGFVGYNTYRTSTGPDAYGESLEDHIRKSGWFGCILLCIHKKI